MLWLSLSLSLLFLLSFRSDQMGSAEVAVLRAPALRYTMKTRHVTPESLYLTRFILHEGGKRFRRDMSRVHLLYLDAGARCRRSRCARAAGGRRGAAVVVHRWRSGRRRCPPAGWRRRPWSLSAVPPAPVRHVVGPAAARHVLTTWWGQPRHDTCSPRAHSAHCCRERGTTYPSVDEARTQERENTRTPSTGQPASPPKRILHHCKQFLTVGESAWHWPLRTKS